MKIFAKVTEAPTPKTENVRPIAFLYAGALVLLAVTQLFSFEEFVQVVAGYGLFGNEALASVKAAFLVVVEVFALPFLLGMQTSRLFRVFSMACGWLAAAWWLIVGFWLVANPVSNAGLFGTVLELESGWWLVLVGLMMAIASAWASWGMWPPPKNSGK